MFKSTNFIDKRNRRTPHYHKASSKASNCAKSDSTGDECNKVFIDNALKWR